MDFAVGEPPHLSSSSCPAAPALSVLELPPTWTHGPNFSNLEHQLEVLRLLVSFLFFSNLLLLIFSVVLLVQLYSILVGRGTHLCNILICMQLDLWHDEKSHGKVTGLRQSRHDHLTSLEIATELLQNTCQIDPNWHNGVKVAWSCEWLGSIKKTRILNQRSKGKLSACNPWPHWYSHCTLTVSLSAYIIYMLDDFKHFQVRLLSASWIRWIEGPKLCVSELRSRQCPEGATADGASLLPWKGTKLQVVFFVAILEWRIHLYNCITYILTYTSCIIWYRYII